MTRKGSNPTTVEPCISYDAVHILMTVKHRYGVTKLMEILLVRELVARLNMAGADAPPVTMNLVDPGLCKSSVTRELEVSFMFRVAIDLVRLVFERTTESGGRAYVLAASAGPSRMEDT
ncbi:hypothetical protein AB5N19_07030 [Seiridium cardinale]